MSYIFQAVEKIHNRYVYLNYGDAANTACERPKLDGILSYAPDDIQSYVSNVIMLWLLYIEFCDVIGEGDGHHINHI